MPHIRRSRRRTRTTKRERVFELRRDLDSVALAEVEAVMVGGKSTIKRRNRKL